MVKETEFSEFEKGNLEIVEGWDFNDYINEDSV